MASVFIDIPGVGNVEAKNAASESTLRELAATMKEVNKKLGGKEPKKEKDKDGGGAKESNYISKMIGKDLSRAAKGFGLVATGATAVVKGLAGVATTSTALIQDLANVGDSLSGAAGALKNIPIAGGLLSTVFGAVASAVEKTTGAYQSAASAGADFGGSISAFTRASSEAGMTMEQFGSLIKSNGEGMLGFGGTVGEGAKRFSQVSKTLRSTSDDLYALGFSTAEINNGLAKYGSMMKQQGLQGTQSNAQLADGAKKYMKELDALAKITGVERSAKEAEMQATLKDAQFQGAMANQTKEVRDSFLSTLGGMAGGMQGPLANFAKDILSTGTATTDENQKLMGMMSGSAKMLGEMRAKMQRGEAVTEQERNALNNLMAAEGAKASKQMGGAFAAAPEFAGTMNALTLAQSQQKDALKNATKEQKEAAAKTDAQNKAAEEAKQQLAALSNGFMSVLAQSGLLTTMMKVFEGLASVVQTVVVPVFQYLAKGITSAVNFVSAMFEGGGMKEGFGKLIETAKGLLSTVGGFFETIALAIDWKGIMTNVTAIGQTMMSTIDGLISALTPTFTAIAEVGQKIFNQLTPIFTDIMDIIKTIADLLAPVLPPIVDAIGDVLGGTFRMIGGIVKIIKGILTMDWDTIVGGLGDVFGGFWDRIVGIFTLFKKIISGGFGVIKGLFSSDAEKEQQKVEAEKERMEEKKADASKEELARMAAVEKQKEEYKKHKEKEQKAEEKKAGDAKKSAEASAAASAPVKDYNDSLSLLKADYEQANGGAAPKSASAAASSSGDATKKSIEANAEKEAAAKKEAETKAGTSGSAGSKGSKPPGSTTPAPAQESAETLLASLNTKLDQLIAVNRNMKDVQDRQLSVQQGLSGDLFASV